MKLSQNDLFILSLSDLQDMIEGHDLDIRGDWERERFGAFLTIQPYLDKKSNLTPKKLFKFPWEDEDKPFEATLEAKEKAKKWGEIIRSGKVKPKDNGKSKN